MTFRDPKVLSALGALLAATIAVASTPMVHAALQTAEELQRKQGTRWIDNYLNVPYVGTLVALLEMLGSEPTAASPTGAPGYLQRNAGYFADEVIDHFQQRLPLVAFDAPIDILNRASPPPTGAQGGSPYISTARTRNGVNAWGDLLYDITHSVHAQAFDIISTLQQRAKEQSEALDKELRDGEGRLALAGPGNARGIGGQNLGRYAIHAGDVKASAEEAQDQLTELAKTQDPGPVAALPPDAPLPPQFVPSSQKPPENPAIPGGSNAGPQLAQNLGILANANPFSGLASVNPSILLFPIANRAQNILNNLGITPDALDRFGGGGPLGDLLNIFGGSRTRDLLGRGGGSSPAPATRPAAEDALCPVAAARHSQTTVANAARLLQLPADAEWTIGLSPATALFGIQGTDFETGERVTISDQLLRPNTCVWVVIVGNDAVFLSDTDPVAFRLMNVI
ncbi:MAG: hypothetical protein G01um101438_636 [Parcubacteria group bacterium Gr01-1014_38]|nr:MAG: hypothetical protein G01um101438_636 [Parcubacteria group bacterium Gr01-1014_38]